MPKQLLMLPSLSASNAAQHKWWSTSIGYWTAILTQDSGNSNRTGIDMNFCVMDMGVAMADRLT